MTDKRRYTLIISDGDRPEAEFTISKHEIELVLAYRKAVEESKKCVRIILDIESTRKIHVVQNEKIKTDQ